MDKRYDFWEGRRQREQISRQLWHLRQRRNDAAIVRREIPPFKEIVAPQNLAEVAKALTIAGPEKAAGPDEVKFSDLSVTERWDICRALSRELFSGRYEPSARRIVELRKRDGGKRPISIRSIAFRIVATVVYEAIHPAIEPAFVPHSYGFIHGRSAWDMLLAMRRDVRTVGKVICLNDVKKAFDFINITLALEDLGANTKDSDLINLVERILRGHHTDIREQADIGIDQGSALSPLILNVLLHHRLDVPLGISVPVAHRYADNLGLVATTELEAQERMQQVGGLLNRIGMELKHPVAPVDLRVPSEQSLELLGYQLGLGQTGELTFSLGATAWKSLVESWAEAYDTDNPTEIAKSAAVGWCNACGPVLENTQYVSITDQILSVAAEYGFRTIEAEHCRRALQGAHSRWQALQASATEGVSKYSLRAAAGASAPRTFQDDPSS